MRQIEFFVVLARELNFTRAASLVHVSQSGLSSSIRSLERELHHPLFERSSRSVDLTPAGRAFLPRASRILEDARAAQLDLARYAEAGSGTLAVAAEQCLGDLIDLPEVLGLFRGRYPGIAVRFEQLGAQALLDGLKQGRLDVALMPEPGGGVRPWAGSEHLESTEIAQDGFELLCADGGDEPATWAELETMSFVALAPDWTARQIVDRAFDARRILHRPSCVVNDLHMLLDLVRQGIGPALIPAPFTSKPQAEGLHRRPVRDENLSWVVHLVTAPESPTARLFTELLFPADSVREMRDDLTRHETAGAVSGT